jgi:branched-chain amino acid transport system permease protein
MGRRLQILRDSPVAASTLGANLALTKLVVFVTCGALAALGGALLGSFQQVITPGNFGFGVSLQLLLLVVLSGRALIAGAVIAGALYTFEHLPGIPASVHSYIPLTIAFGVIALGRSPEGLVSIFTGQGLGLPGLFRPRYEPVGQRPVAVEHRVGVQ